MRNFSIAIFVFILLSSCTVSEYYQVYKTSSNNLTESQGNLCFENTDVKIFYNLWDQGGNVGFVIYNKTDSVILLKKDASFYLCNGMAYDYFQNRTYTFSNSSSNVNSQSSTISNSTSTQMISSNSSSRISSGLSDLYYGGYLNSMINGSSNSNVKGSTNTSTKSISQESSYSTGVAVSINEQNVMKIPPHSAKMVAEFKIVHNRYINCDLLKYPKNKEEGSLKFKEEESPLKFGNIISYSLNGATKTIENFFFVNEISNLSSNDFYQYRYDTLCEKQMAVLKPFPKFINPKSFYFPY